MLPTRLAVRPAGFGEHFRETFWGKKREKTLAGRPAGFGQKEKEEDES